MSSIRNSLHRRSHKERSQLSHRSRLGILEKHKDYVLRARDYHSKQDRIKRLQEKAATRNKDEFYFSMTREKTVGGVHVQDRGNAALPTDIVKVLKTQDENYLRTTRAAGQKKIDKLKEQLSQLANLLKSSQDDEGTADLDEEELEVLREAGVLAPTSKRGRKKSHSKRAKHIVFAEDEEEARQHAAASKVGPSTSNPPEDDRLHKMVILSVDMGWRTPEEGSRKKRKSRSVVDEAMDVDAKPSEGVEEPKEHRSRLLKELSARLVRDKQLRYAERELQMQRLLMGKGASRKISGVERVDGEDDEDDEEFTRPKKVDEKTWKPRVYKWRVERKR